MSILVDEKTRVLVQGLGREGGFHAQQCIAYGTRIVGAVKPGKGGTKQDGIPLFDSVAQARREVNPRASMIFVPPAGGAYIRDGGLKLIGEGITTRNEVFDPTPQTEPEMQVTTGTPAQRASDQALNSFIVPKDIESVAKAVRDYKGVVFGLYLSPDYNNDPTNLEPPATQTDLGHALYLFDYHLHNGVKCTIAKSSWCGTYGGVRHHLHHIKENYYLSGMTFNPWTLIPKENQVMIEFVHIEGTNEYGLLVSSAVGKQYVPASTEADLKARFPQVPLKPDGSVDYSKARDIKL